VIGPRVRAVGVALLTLSSSHAHAWNDTGHYVITLAAIDALPVEVRDRLLVDVRAHPRYRVDFEARRPHSIERGGAQAIARFDFAQASTWPDLARHFSHVAVAREREALVGTYHRGRWHYVNLPTLLDADPIWARTLEPMLLVPTHADTLSFNIVQALHLHARTLTTSTVPQDRAIALAWFLHLVGDLHQPLHATALFARGRFELGDRGGNEIRVDDTNLHALWDGALGTSRARRAIDSSIRRLPRPDARQVTELDFATWAAESQAIAAQSIYTSAVRAAVRTQLVGDAPIVIELGADDRAAMQRIAMDRAALAAARLAAWLMRFAVAAPDNAPDTSLPPP